MEREEGVVLLEVVEGSPLLTEVHDRLVEAAEIWRNFDVWFDLDEQAIFGRRKACESSKVEVVR